MGKFERHFAGVPAEAATLPRANVQQLADTGQGLEAQALQQAGAGLQDIAGILFKWNEREGNSQYDTSVGEAHLAFGEFERTAFENTTEHEAAYKTLTEKTIPDLAGKNKSGAKKFKAYIKGKQKAAWDRTAAEKQIRMVKQNAEVALFKALTDVAQITDPATAKVRINALAGGAVMDKLKTADQAINMRDRAQKDWTRADIWRKATQFVRPDGEVDWSQAVKWFDNAENIAGLPEDIVEDFAGTVRSQATVQKRRDEKIIRNRQNRKRDEIYEMIEANSEDTITTINNSRLPGKEKAVLRALARKPDVTFNFTEYNKVVDIIDGITEGTHTEEQADRAIAEGAGKHYDGTVARSLRSKLSEKSKTDSPLTTTQAKRAQDSIGRMREAEIGQIKTPLNEEGLLEVRALEDKYLRISNEYDAYLLSEEGRKATDDQKQKKFQALTGPIREEVALGFISRALRKERGVQFFGLITSEERALVNKKIKVLKDEGVWEGLSKEDRDSVKRAFEGGSTVDEAVTGLGRGEQGVTATNPDTGEKMITFDGGKTWQSL